MKRRWVGWGPEGLRALKLVLTSGCAAGAFICSLFGATVIAGEAQLYRFTNAQGKVEISSSIPNDRVKFGYDVLDASGRVIRRIGPELSGAELEEKRKREAELAKCRETWRRVSTMYQTEADIDRFEAEEIEALETAVANERANLQLLKGQHADLLAQAARIERSGGSLTSVLVQNIERAAAQVKLLERSVSRRESERKRISSRFNGERAAFRRGSCRTETVTTAATAPASQTSASP